MLKKYVCTHIAYPSPPLPTEHFWSRRVQYRKRKPSVYIYKQDKVQIAAIQTSLLWPSTDLGYKRRGASFLTVAGDSRLEDKISTSKCPHKISAWIFPRAVLFIHHPGPGRSWLWRGGRCCCPHTCRVHQTPRTGEAGCICTYFPKSRNELCVLLPKGLGRAVRASTTFQTNWQLTSMSLYHTLMSSPGSTLLGQINWLRNIIGS